MDSNALIIMVITSVTILTSVHWLTRAVITNIALINLAAIHVTWLTPVLIIQDVQRELNASQQDLMGPLPAVISMNVTFLPPEVTSALVQVKFVKIQLGHTTAWWSISVQHFHVMKGSTVLWIAPVKLVIIAMTSTNAKSTPSVNQGSTVWIPWEHFLALKSMNVLKILIHVHVANRASTR